MELDTLSDTETKRLIILYRAINDYSRGSVQGRIRFLFPKVPLGWSERNELERATYWWKRKLSEDERQKLLIEYKIAAKQK